MASWQRPVIRHGVSRLLARRHDRLRDAPDRAETEARSP
ncbi:MAG: hypothetical protein RL456_943 [Pseudomonadota bacterium]|jgi:hypothetical protein